MKLKMVIPNEAWTDQQHKEKFLKDRQKFFQEARKDIEDFAKTVKASCSPALGRALDAILQNHEVADHLRITKDAYIDSINSPKISPNELIRAHLKPIVGMIRRSKDGLIRKIKEARRVGLWHLTDPAITTPDGYYANHITNVPIEFDKNGRATKYRTEQATSEKRNVVEQLDDIAKLFENEIERLKEYGNSRKSGRDRYWLVPEVHKVIAKVAKKRDIRKLVTELSKYIRYQGGKGDFKDRELERIIQDFYQDWTGGQKSKPSYGLKRAKAQKSKNAK
jgi:hypothetical protein